MSGVTGVAQRFHRHRAGELDQGIVGEFETGPLRGQYPDWFGYGFEQSDLPRRDLDELEYVGRQGVAIEGSCSRLDDEVGELEGVPYFVTYLVGNEHYGVADRLRIGRQPTSAGERRFGWAIAIAGLWDGLRFG